MVNFHSKREMKKHKKRKRKRKNTHKKSNFGCK